MICTMLSLILLNCFILRIQRRGMFVVKSGRAVFLNRGPRSTWEDGGGIPSHVCGVPGMFDTGRPTD